MVIAKVKNSILRKLVPYLYRYRYRFIILVVLAILGNILTLVGPFLVGKAINQIHMNMSRENFIFLAEISICLLVTYISGAFLSLLQNIKMNIISQEIVNSMRKDAFNKVHKFPLSAFNKMSQGNILTILINDIDNISSSLSQIGTRIVVNLLTIFTALVIMVYISPTLTIIQLILVGVAGIFLKEITKRSKEKRRVQQKYLGKLNSYIDEILTGQAEVKSFSYENRAIAEFRKMNKSYKENATKALFFSGFNFPSLNFINNIGYSLIIFVGAIFILKGRINLGELSSFIIYSKLFNRPIASISEAYNIIQTVIVSSERFFQFMDLKEDTLGGKRVMERDEIKGDIVFKDVEFSYDGENRVLNSLNFEVKAGQVVAIVGPTGGGKTTIVNLLMKFFDISAGTITIDGVNIDEYKKTDIRNLFGMVLQDSWLFTGSIEENIRYGNEKLTHEDIVNTAKLACAHDFISKFPEGYGTIVSEDNMVLSQGQKQLITIARVIASNPKFLILDEATSGVDTRTELRLQKAISNITQNRTSFVIAHRLSTIKNADLILVLKDGTIIEKGTHQELMELNGFYKTMYDTQYAL